MSATTRAGSIRDVNDGGSAGSIRDTTEACEHDRPRSAARRAWIAALCGCIALAACGGGSGSNGSAASSAGSAPNAAGSRADRNVEGPAGVLRRGNGPEPDSLDPQLARADSAANVLRDLYEGLTVLDTKGEPAPGAAEKWDVSADGLTYTFHLRESLRWSNGEPLSAQDFVASWRRLVTPATGGQYAQLLAPVANASEIVSGRAKPEALGVAAPDARTVVVTLRSPTPYFLALAAHWSTLPVYGGHAPGRAGTAVSNGAFTLADWTVGSHVTAKRNRNYWNDAATRIDEVRYFHIPDANDEYTRYRAGELDVTYVLPQQPIAKLRATHGAELVTGPQLGVLYYGFNLAKPPFGTSPGLRQALTMTIDRDRLVKSVTNLGEPAAYSWVPVGTANYEPQRPEWAALPYEQRVARAKQLYAAAGFGTATPLRFELRFPTGATNERVALAVSAMWKSALGVDVKLVPEEFKSLMQSVNRGDAQLFRASWVGDYNDANTFLQLLASDFGINLPKYRSAEYDTLLADAARATDPAIRREKLQAAERRLLADVPVMPLFFFVNKHLVSPRVQGWYDNPTNVVYSRNLSLR